MTQAGRPSVRLGLRHPCAQRQRPAHPQALGSAAEAQQAHGSRRCPDDTMLASVLRLACTAQGVQRASHGRYRLEARRPFLCFRPEQGLDKGQVPRVARSEQLAPRVLREAEVASARGPSKLRSSLLGLICGNQRTFVASWVGIGPPTSQLSYMIPNSFRRTIPTIGTPANQRRIGFMRVLLRPT